MRKKISVSSRRKFYWEARRPIFTETINQGSNRILKKYISEYGIPKQDRSDPGTVFTTENFETNFVANFK